MDAMRCIFGLSGALVEAAGNATGNGGSAAGEAAMAGFFAMFGMMYIFIMAFYCLILVFALASIAIWLWMLIDCLRRDDFSGENDKLIWALILIFGGILGAVIYYFLVKKEKDSPKEMERASKPETAAETKARPAQSRLKRKAAE